MANEIKKPSNGNTDLPANIGPDVNPYIAYGDAVAASRIVGKMLKFTKFGEFEAGEEQEDIPLGTELIVHPEEILVGFIKWENSRPVDHVMGRLCDGFDPPKRAELGDLDRTLWEVDDKGVERDPWQLSAYMIAYDPKQDQLYTFATASKGGHKAIGMVSRAYGMRSRMAPDMFPVVRLGMSSYMHSNKQYGEIRNPVFEVIGWTYRGNIDNALEEAKGVMAEQADADANPSQLEIDYYAPKETPKAQSRAAQASQQRVKSQPAQAHGEPPKRQPLSSATRKPRF